MAIVKPISYKLLDTDGQVFEKNYKLHLKINTKSGNYLVHKDILRHQTNKHQLTACTKTRSEVKGGGKKPWKQKGTGQARAGSKRSPLWRGGGQIFGPKPRLIKNKINKKERKLALQTLLFNKRNKIKVLNNFENEFTIPKTKSFISVCEKCKLDLTKTLLIIVLKKTNSLRLSVQNIRTINLISASCLNTYDLLKAEQIILTPDALTEIKDIFCE